MQSEDLTRQGWARVFFNGTEQDLLFLGWRGSGSRQNGQHRLRHCPRHVGYRPNIGDLKIASPGTWRHADRSVTHHTNAVPRDRRSSF